MIQKAFMGTIDQLCENGGRMHVSNIDTDLYIQINTRPCDKGTTAVQTSSSKHTPDGGHTSSHNPQVPLAFGIALLRADGCQCLGWWMTGGTNTTCQDRDLEGQGGGNYVCRECTYSDTLLQIYYSYLMLFADYRLDSILWSPACARMAMFLFLRW